MKTLNKILQNLKEVRKQEFLNSMDPIIWFIHMLNYGKKPMKWILQSVTKHDTK